MSQPPPPPPGPPPPGPQQPPGHGGQSGWPTPPPGGGQGPWSMPPPGYPGYPAYGGPPPPGFGGTLPPHPQATTVLVLGICSLAVGLICGIGFLLGPPAWIMGHGARREMRERPGAWSGDGQITAGWIMGIISSVVLIIGLVFLLIAIIIEVASS